MLSSYDNRKAPRSIIRRGLHGLTVWWTAQGPLQQPADRDDTDRVGSYDGNITIVSGPSPPPTTINKMKAPHVSAQFVTFTEGPRSDGICCQW
jgi:hypothetical protein